MVTIGATAGGYVKGTENTMFSKWNKGLIDIFKEDYIPSKQTGDNDEDPPNNVYASEFWLKRYAAYGLTYPQSSFASSIAGAPDACALLPEIIDKNLELVSEFYKYCQYKIQKENQKYASPTNGFIPISLGITLEGISGIKIYNAVNVDTRFLPSNYPNNLNFIIKGVNHKISNGRWETNLETVVIAKSEKEGLLTYSQIKGFVNTEIAAGVAASNPNPAESTLHIASVFVAPLTWASIDAAIASAFSSLQSLIPNNPLTPGGIGTQAEQDSIAAAGSLLEQKVGEAAAIWFNRNGSTTLSVSTGMCGKGSTGIAIILGNLLTGQNNPYRSGNDADSETLRNNWNKIGIYKPESCTQPVLANATFTQIKNYINTTVFNPGDGMVYYIQPGREYGSPHARVNGKFRMHAQIYTANIYKNIKDHKGRVSVGWSTDGISNYGTNLVYSGPETDGDWFMYHFKIKDEYKGKNVIPGRVNPTSTPIVNNGAMEMYLGHNLPKAQVTALKSLSEKCFQLIGERITSSHIATEIQIEGSYQILATGIDSTTSTQMEKFLKAARNSFPSLAGEIKKTSGGWRSYQDQITLFTNNLRRDGSIANRQKSSALVGFSQHHTGKAIDICSVNLSWWNESKHRPFKQWVAENCGAYGFRLPYKVAKIRSEEPWHLQYVGGGTK
jgi:hypothetical protein